MEHTQAWVESLDLIPDRSAPSFLLGARSHSGNFLPLLPGPPRVELFGVTGQVAFASAVLGWVGIRPTLGVLKLASDRTFKN